MSNFDATYKKALQAAKGLDALKKKYTVHGHFVRKDGTQDRFWTRTGLTKSAAQKLAAEQRREGGVARVVPDSEYGF